MLALSVRRWLQAAALCGVASLSGCAAKQDPSALEAASKKLADNPAAEVPPPPPRAARRHPSTRPADAGGAPASRPATTQVAAAPAAPSSQTGPAAEPAPSAAVPKAAPAPAGGPFETAHVEFDGDRILLLGRVEFDGSHRFIHDAGKRILDDVARLLTQRPQIAKVEIQSHRHSRMTTDGGKVTQVRADAVRSYLIGKGIDGSRLKAVGYEDTVPIDTNRTAEGRRANTRIELEVLELRK